MSDCNTYLSSFTAFSSLLTWKRGTKNNMETLCHCPTYCREALLSFYTERVQKWRASCFMEQRWENKKKTRLSEWWLHIKFFFSKPKTNIKHVTQTHIVLSRPHTQTHTQYLSSRQPLVSVVTPDARVTVLLLLLLHVLHTANTFHRLHI